MVASAIATVVAAGLSASISAGSANAMNERTLRANRQAMRDQALMDRWFAENTHQMEVGDLKKAGLNPVLSATNGTSTQSVSALSNPQGDSIDPQLGQVLNGAIANINSAKAVDSQNSVNDASINYINEQAKTEEFKRQNLYSDTVFKGLQSQAKQIENLYLPDTLKANLKKINNEAQAVLMNASASNIMANASAKQAEYNMQRLPYQNLQDKTNSLYNNSLGRYIDTQHNYYGRFSPFDRLLHHY